MYDNLNKDKNQSIELVVLNEEFRQQVQEMSEQMISELSVKQQSES